MAPHAAVTIIPRANVEKDFKTVSSESVMKSEVKRPLNACDLNNKSRKLIKQCFNNLRSNLNVLVIGQKESGKSSLINSMNMALTQEWKDRARYCPGRNHIVDPCVMYSNRDEKKSKWKKVVFWDTRGFESIHNEEQAVLILRYVLEGRIAPKCIPCVLLMSIDMIKKRYSKCSAIERRIDLVLTVSSLNVEPQTKLMGIIQKAVTSSKVESINKLPILSVATKLDILDDQQKEEQLKRLQEYDFEHFVDAHRELQHSTRRRRPRTAPDVRPSTKLIVNYCCELEPWSDESADPTAIQSSIALDTKLLGLWRDIVSMTSVGTDFLRSSSPPPNPKPMFLCLPFRLPYSRLRSNSL